MAPLDRGARGATAGTVKQALGVSEVAAPGLTPGLLQGRGAIDPVTSAKGHRHEEAWTPGPARLFPQTADGAKAVCRPHRGRAQHQSQWGSAGRACEGPPGRACWGPGTPGTDRGAEPAARRPPVWAPPCSWGRRPAGCAEQPARKAGLVLERIASPRPPWSRRSRCFRGSDGTVRRQRPVCVLCLY